MKHTTLAGLGLVAGLLTTANAAQVLHYWDMDTLNAGVPTDVIGGLATAVQNSSASGGLVLENATYGSAYGGGGNYLLTQTNTNGTHSGAGNAGDDTILTDHLRATLSGSDMNFGTADFSFSYWSYNQSDTEGGIGNDPRGPRIFDNLSGVATGIQLGSNLAGVFNYRTDAVTGSVLSNNTLTTLVQAEDAWTFVTVNVSRTTGLAEIFLFDGAGGLADGSQGSYTIAGLAGDVLPSQAFLEIGAINGGANGGGMQDAGLDDLAFYSGTLTPAEIGGLAAGSLTPDLIPEPSSLLLLGFGAFGLLRRRR